MITISLIVTLLAAQTPPTPPRLPTIVAYGDSRFQGGLCGTTSPLSPPNYVDINLPGGAGGGWLVKNAAITGYTPAQVLTAYNAGEATACNGERCAYLMVNGGVNCMRADTDANVCIVSSVTLVDDALAKGYVVLWTSETDWSAWSQGGSNRSVQFATWMTAWNAACAARASNTRLKCVDISVVMGNPLQNTCDGVHQNQTATNLLGSTLLSALLSIPN